MKYAIPILIFLSACGKTNDGHEPAPAQAQTEAVEVQTICENRPILPTKVKLKNRLVGQIRQLAMGVDGWTAIGSADLVMECGVESNVIVCEAFPYEPFPYKSLPSYTVSVQ